MDYYPSAAWPQPKRGTAILVRRQTELHAGATVREIFVRHEEAAN
jgi:hypothetical protein